MDSPHSAGPSRGQHLYFTACRWHFYASLVVAPFLLMLALTGGVMMIYAASGNELGYSADVAVTGPALSPSLQARAVQAQAALATVSGGEVATYIAPPSLTRPARRARPMWKSPPLGRPMPSLSTHTPARFWPVMTRRTRGLSGRKTFTAPC